MTIIENSGLNEMFRLDGRVALVTGAGRGIGAAIAKMMSEAGATVMLIARTSDEIEALAQEINKKGGVALAQACDITDSNAIVKLIEGMPNLDIVVNNAGTNIPEPFTEVSEKNLDVMWDLNARATFIVAQAAVRKMLSSLNRLKHGGSVINISSQMGHVGSPNRTVYCMTKHAVEGLTKAMAVELAGKGIRVNSIAPTFVDTPLVRKIVDTPEKKRFVLSNIPMGHLASVTDIAAAALYLASPASSMVTGTCLRVDGGWTAQ